MKKCCFCCSSSFAAGCVSPCETVIDFGAQVPAGKGGVWTLEREFKTRVYRSTNTLNEGDNIIFAVGDLNEAFCYKARLVAPDGSTARFVVSSVEYDCINFQTQQNAEQVLRINASSIVS